MFDPQNDPLGLGLKQRNRDTRMAAWAENPALTALQSPLGEDWDAYFQAAEDATGGRPLKFAAGAPPPTAVPDINILGASDVLYSPENQQFMASRQLRGLRPSLAGLKKR